MKKSLLLIPIFSVIASSQNTSAQTRYVDEMFTSVSVTSDIIYGNNLTVLQFPTIAAEDLKMDVYQPTGDTQTERPLVIVIHSGNFLPAVINGSPTGTKTDSAIVELCTQFAKRGYVAAAMDYRQGWDPLSTDQNIRTGTIINAAYRGVQDAKACVRYFRKDVATSGNTYGVDTSKIVLGGVGTGAYVAFAFASFDDWAEIFLAKFTNFDSTPPEPYIDTALSGDWDNLLDRPLSTSNNLGYSSAINMTFTLGGAMGDSIWLEAGDVPMVGFHCINDPNAPYDYGAVIVPTTGDFVLNASGNHGVLNRAKYLGNNSVIIGATFSDYYTQRADAINDGIAGLFPFAMPAPSTTPTACGMEKEQGSPWDWWDETSYSSTVDFYNGAGYLPYDGPTGVCLARLSNPDMSASKGRAYIDTVMSYLNPRISCILGLNPCGTVGTGDSVVVGLDYIQPLTNLTIFPNPSSYSLTIKSSQVEITGVELYDVTGRLVFADNGLNTKLYTLDRGYLVNGLYFIKVKSENAEMDMKILLQ